MATNAIAASGNMIQHYSTVFSKLSENIANVNTPSKSTMSLIRVCALAA